LLPVTREQILTSKTTKNEEERITIIPGRMTEDGDSLIVYKSSQLRICMQHFISKNILTALLCTCTGVHVYIESWHSIILCQVLLVMNITIMHDEEVELSC